MATEAEIREAFRRQAAGARRLGSPFMGMLNDLFAERLAPDGEIARRVLAWPGSPGPDGLSIRLCGGLHALVRSGAAPALAAAYQPNTPTPDPLWDAVAEALEAHAALLGTRLDTPPQTNEIGRSSIILGGTLTIAAAMRRPLALFEIGSSAGLNLGFDRYAYDFGDGKRWGDAAAPVLIPSEWQGEGPRLDARLKIVARAGCDLRPLDPSSAADRERLLSFVWPDQTPRLTRLAAALEMARSAEWRVEEEGEAAEWLAGRLAELDGEGVVRVVFHTVVWQYLPPATKAAIAATMAAVGARATPTAPLAWLAMEDFDETGAPSVRLTLWPNGSEYRLGLADFHGRWVRWQRPVPVTP